MSDRILSCEGPPVYETQYDSSSSNTLFRTIIEAIATVAETPPVELAPLHDTIDVGALERFLEHASAGARNTTVSIGFSVETWTVLVHSDGHVLVYEPADEAIGRDDAAARTRNAADSD